MAWRRSGDKPLSEPMMVSLLTHICVTRLQWVEKTHFHVVEFWVSCHTFDTPLLSLDWPLYMMTSSNGNIFCVTGPLCGEFTGPGKFPAQRPVTRSFDVFFDLGLNKRLSKQPRDWWIETLSWSLWRQCNDRARIGPCNAASYRPNSIRIKIKSC